MLAPPLLSILALVVSTLFFADVVLGDFNVTVDSTNGTIVFNGTWGENPSPFAIGGSHAFSLDRNATASFNFTGVAIYYLAPLWPYTVNTLVTLDSNQSFVVNLTDSLSGTVGESEDEPATVLWSLTGLTNTQHTLVASMWDEGIYVVMDALIFTVSDETSSTINPVSPVSDTTPRPSSSSALAATSSQMRNITRSLNDAILAILCGILAILIVAAIIYITRKRRNWTVAESSATRSIASSSSMSLPEPYIVQIVDLRKTGSRMNISSPENHISSISQGGDDNMVTADEKSLP